MKILFISLGCDKNLVDSENMIGLLKAAGHELTDDETEAEIIVVNTCCFIGDAKEESVNTILEMAEYKTSGSLKGLIVAGCLAQRYQQEILEEIPEVDAVIGTMSWDAILDAVDAIGSGTPKLIMKDIASAPHTEEKRIVTTGGHYAHLKIAEGCDKHCTYCIIPKLRGPFRSVPMEELVEEAKRLGAQGVKELILVAQETTLYGMDLYGKKMLHELLKKLCEIDDIYWIRIQYCYPEEIYDDLIKVMKEEEKICHYLDLPIQHASDNVLKRMGRRTDKQQLIDVIQKLRREIPDICLRTTLIAGFPGETEEEHREVMEFVDEMEFDRLGVFSFSCEEGTPAFLMEGQLPDDVKDDRRDDLMELQMEISADLEERMIGRVLLCMVEGKVADENAYVARTYMDAPGVDGYIFINTTEILNSGDFVNVRVTGAMEYDLIGEIADEFTE